jgi:hypothetical protein
MELLPLISQLSSVAGAFWKVQRTDVAPDGDKLDAIIELSLDTADGSDDFLIALLERTRRSGKRPVLIISLTLHREFPRDLPEVRLIEPVLVPGTGGVINGVFMLPCLWPEGWQRIDVPVLMQLLRDHIIASSPRLDAESSHYYNFQAYTATHTRILQRSSPAWHHPTTFSKRYCVYGSSFATTVLGLSLPEGFDAGNKIIMPSVALAQMAQSELQALEKDEDLALKLQRGGQEARTRLIRCLQGSASAESSNFMGGESAMLFEIVSVLRFPVFVGVSEFTMPHPDLIILPQQVLQGMGIPEGSEVACSRALLPPIEGLQLQPHSVNFDAVEAFTDRGPREFLEASLTRFSCLQTGDVIMCDGGHGISGGAHQEFWFTVTRTQPVHALAVALWADFSSQVAIDFLPSADSFLTPPTPSVEPPTALPVLAAAPEPLRVEVQESFRGVGRTLAEGSGANGASAASVPAAAAVAVTADERELRRQRAAAAASRRVAQPPQDSESPSTGTR